MESMHRVNVLISTYNGERYIDEQIESILGQTYKNIKIYIRDDGSKDSTCNVINKYADDDRFEIICGETLGYGKSFLNLLKEADSGEYWAYCDQDDVWFPEKIETAVAFLEQQKGDEPWLFHSAYYNTDEELNILELVKAPDYPFDFPKAITQCIYMGFSDVFNAALRDIILKANIDNMITHDWWTELVAVKYGNLYYDDRPMTYHRRLSKSVSGNALMQRIRWFGRAWKGNAEIRSCTSEFERVFGYDPYDRDSAINQWFCGGYSLGKAVKKAFYPHRWRPTFSSEIVMRILMLFGKI